MTHSINWLIPDRLVEITFTGEMDTQDLLVLNRLDLQSRTKRIYVLFAYNNVQLTVPQDALQVLDKSQGTHPMIGFIALYGAPTVIEVFGRLLVKVAGLKNIRHYSG